MRKLTVFVVTALMLVTMAISTASASQLTATPSEGKSIEMATAVNEQVRPTRRGVIVRETVVIIGRDGTVVIVDTIIVIVD